MHEEASKVEKINTTSQRKKQKSIKLYSNTNSITRAPSREFNDPIYAGFDINQDNRQHYNWGPWVQNNQSIHKPSHSLHSNLNKVIPFSNQLQFRTINLEKRQSPLDLNHHYSQSALLKRKSIVISQLPEIKQKCKPNLLQFKMASTELLNKKLTIKKQDIRYKSKPLLHKDDKLFSRRPLDPAKNRIKISAVVYNYCTNNNIDECLLNYNKKVEPPVQKSTSKKQKQMKQQMLLTKYEGLKAYWKRRNSTHKPM